VWLLAVTIKTFITLHIPGSVLAAYISFGAQPAHILTASIMSAPAALCMSKLVYPETEDSKTTTENIKLDRR
jgi:pyrimidine nucleoside transport protein